MSFSLSASRRLSFTLSAKLIMQHNLIRRSTFGDHKKGLVLLCTLKVAERSCDQQRKPTFLLLLLLLLLRLLLSLNCPSCNLWAGRGLICIQSTPFSLSHLLRWEWALLHQPASAFEASILQVDTTEGQWDAFLCTQRQVKRNLQQFRGTVRQQKAQAGERVEKRSAHIKC